MKSQVCAESSTNAVLSLKTGSRVQKMKSKELENEEIQSYLTKLQELVPDMPKNKKLSKLEVIEYVIDYICDLQCALETHPATGKCSSPNAANRQPLGVISTPNTFGNTSEISSTSEKTTSPAESDSRLLSC